jgi:uncharacterized membrane protein
MAVHFPIALVFLWPVIDAVGLLLKRADVSRVGLALLLLAVGVSLFATATGQAAFEAAIAKGVDAEVLNTHADDANLIPWALVLVAAVRFLGAQKLKAKGQIAGIVLGVLLWPLVIRTGDSGGRLVFEHAVGVKAGSTR